MKTTRLYRTNTQSNKAKTQKPIALAIAMTLAGLSQPVLSGGFQLSDHSVTSLGRAHAGYGVYGDDASAAHFNPAGMSLLKKRQFQIGGSYSAVEGEYTPDNTLSSPPNRGSGDDGAQDALVPNIYLVIPISDRINYGFGITSPYGTNTDYDPNFSGTPFAGRFSGLKTELKTIDVNSSFSFKVNDFISLGAGISYQTLETKLSAATGITPTSTVNIDGDSDEFGYNFGIMFNFKDNSRIGIGYRSEIEHTIEGGATYTGVPTDSATAEFTSPETIYIGYVNPLSEKWSISLGARWTDWSSFQALTIQIPDSPVSTTVELDTEWNNSWTVMIGADYKLNSKWTLRAGYGDDQTPSIDATRSVRTVNSDRKWYSIGATYISSEKLQFDFAYRYIGFDKAPVNRTTGPGGILGPIVGSFDDINIHTFAAQVNYKF